MKLCATRSLCLRLGLVKTIVTLFVLTIGCEKMGRDEVDNFVKKHYVLEKKDADKLDGPYKMREVLSPNSIRANKGKQEFVIILRGCMPTNQKEMDFKATKLLGPMAARQIYLLKDCSTVVDETTIRSVVYVPATQNYIGKDEDGNMQYDTLSYTMRQLLLLPYGYCKLDRSDTEYPLYPLFLEAEELAKKHRKGYWETH